MKIAIARDHGGYQLKEERCLADITIPTCCPWAAERRRWTRLWKSWEPGWTLNLRAAAIREEWTCSTHKTAPHALACFRRKTGRREGMTGGAGFA